MHVKLRLGGTDSYPLLGSPLAVAPPGCDGHFLPSAYGGSRASDGCRPIGTGAGLAAGVWAAVRQPTFNNPRLSCRVWALGLTILTRRPCRRFNDAMRRWLHGGCETTALQNQRDRQSRRQGDGMRPDGSSRRDVLNRPGRDSRACPQHIHRPKSGNLRDSTATCCARIHRLAGDRAQFGLRSIGPPGPPVSPTLRYIMAWRHGAVIF